MINIWIAFSSQAITEFKSYRSDPRQYNGPMDRRTFRIMRTMADSDNVERLFKKVTLGGKTYTLFSLYSDNAKAVNRINYINTKWGNHIIVVGAWDFKTGLAIWSIL